MATGDVGRSSVRRLSPSRLAPVGCSGVMYQRIRSTAACAPCSGDAAEVGLVRRVPPTSIAMLLPDGSNLPANDVSLTTETERRAGQRDRGDRRPACRRSSWSLHDDPRGRRARRSRYRRRCSRQHGEHLLAVQEAAARPARAARPCRRRARSRSASCMLGDDGPAVPVVASIGVVRPGRARGPDHQVRASRRQTVARCVRSRAPAPAPCSARRRSVSSCTWVASSANFGACSRAWCAQKSSSPTGEDNSDVGLCAAAVAAVGRGQWMRHGPGHRSIEPSRRRIHAHRERVVRSPRSRP